MISLSQLHPWRPAWRAIFWATLLLPVFALIHFPPYCLRFCVQISAAPWQQFRSTVVAAVAIQVAIFSGLRIDQDWSRFVTFHDLVVCPSRLYQLGATAGLSSSAENTVGQANHGTRKLNLDIPLATLVKAVTVSSLLLLVFEDFLRSGAILPRSVPFLDWRLPLVVVGGLRAGSQFMKESALPAFFSRDEPPVYLVGANDSWEALLREIRRSRRLPYWVVGFLANEPAAVSSQIGGVPVIGLWDQMCELARCHRVSHVLITAGDLPGQRVRQPVDQAARARVTVTVLPSYEQLLYGAVLGRGRYRSRTCCGGNGSSGPRYRDCFHGGPPRGTTRQLVQNRRKVLDRRAVNRSYHRHPFRRAERRGSTQNCNGKSSLLWFER